MLLIPWLKGVLTHRPGRLLGAMTGVALTVALLSSLGAFMTSSSATMTRRAVAGIPIDWQIQLAPGANIASVKSALGKITPYSALDLVGYADVNGMSATTGGTLQTTGPGKILGVSSRYRRLFPAEIRQLTGASQGVLVAQQTAANLHVREGDIITVKRVGVPPATVKVDGIVDLPDADALFQAIGIPAGISPQAPPDNVLLLPIDQWHRIFDSQAVVRPESVRQQLHVRISHRLPTDPSAAYIQVQQKANHLEARIAGSGMVGNNLAARLGGVRDDALYSRVLFLFLGLPGAVLSILLLLSVSTSGGKRRHREQALLRTRGASVAQIMKLEAMEALWVGLGGIVIGIGLALLADRWLVPIGILTSRANMFWLGGAAVLGLVLAVIAVLYPAWWLARKTSVVGSRAAVRKTAKPFWQRIYLDWFMLAVAITMFWRTANSGYQIVLAPEGVPSVSVQYEAFIAPLFFWIGGVLLAIRLWERGLEHGKRPLSRILRPISGGLSGVVSASLGRQRLMVARGMVLVALALSFAVSTAIFNTTYNAQARVDAELTNGADVNVTGPTHAAPGSKLMELRSLPGVISAQPMQHRFAYVGNDLQDIYGIDPRHIGEATDMSNAFFAEGNAQATLNALANRPDGVLVAEETAKDFQLRSGDRINLRLQNVRDHQYHVIPFHFVGVVREFPTAPRDSFLVANARYIGEQTGSSAHEVVLLRTSGRPAQVADRARKIVKPLIGTVVTDIGSTQKTISSSLTAVDLHGLTLLELIFAVLLVAGATGLILALGLAERKRTFTILAAIGAADRQLGAFLWSEALLILVGGSIVGIILGFWNAFTLVKVLTGVFDPPPEFLTIPWGYLALLIIAAIVSTALAVIGVKSRLKRPVVEDLRNL